MQKHLLYEASMLAQCESPYIVKYYGESYQQAVFCIVMEYCSLGSLAQLINPAYQFQWIYEKKVQVAYEILCGIDYLHTNDIVHGDIKPANIVLNALGKAKIIDFGLASNINKPFPDILKTICRHTHPTTTEPYYPIGTLRYIDPDILSGELKRPQKSSDIFSYGRTLYQLNTGKAPWQTITEPERLKTKILSERTESVPISTPAFFQQTMTKCYAPKESRASAQSLLGFFQSTFQSTQSHSTDLSKHANFDDVQTAQL